MDASPAIGPGGTDRPYHHHPPTASATAPNKMPTLARIGQRGFVCGERAIEVMRRSQL